MNSQSTRSKRQAKLALSRLWRRGLLRNESGAISIYVAMTLPFLVGLTLLVIDGSRLSNLDTSLQNGVDALALAAAAELDRRPDAHVRACRAMVNLIENQTLFVTGDATLNVACDGQGNATAASDATWRWLKSLPPDDCDLNAAPSLTGCAYELSSDPSTTYYIQVTSRNSAADFAMLMPAAYVGVAAVSTLTREAVAGMSRVVCKPTPIMICNPWESAGMDTVPELRTQIGKIATARQYGGGSAPIGPGQFGLLDPGNIVDTCNTGSTQVVNTLTWQLAGAPLPGCQVRNGVCPKTGVVASLDKAVNSRFDIYEGPIANYLTSNPSALIPAARTFWNTLSAGANGCKRTPRLDTDEIWYPRSDNWDRVAYFNRNKYNATAKVVLPDGTEKAISSLTRYETYQWEVAQAEAATTPGLPYTKPADQTCFATKPGGLSVLNQLGFSSRVKRRNLYASIVNCNEIGAAIQAGAAYSLNGASTTLPLPTVAVAEFFITEPVNRTLEVPPLGAAGADAAVGSNAKFAWPQATCPLAVPPFNAYAFDFSVTGNSASMLRAGRTYYFYGPTQMFEATLPAGTTPTVGMLADGLRQATASLVGTSSEYVFCTRSGSPNYLFFATKEASTKNDFALGLTVLDGDKQIRLELTKVFAADNGSDVTRDFVRLNR